MTKTILPFKTEKTKELITPNSGLTLYLELYRALKIRENVRDLFPKPGSSKGFDANVYVLSILILFLAGGKYIEDIRKIQLDKALKKVGNLSLIPSPDAIGDWMRNNSLEKMHALKIIHRRLSKRFLKKVMRKTHTLDIDAFEIVSNKDTAKFTYKFNKGYMPIVGHLAELDWCVGYEFREGNDSPNARNLEFLKQCFKNLPKSHQITRVRIDSAGYQGDIFKFLDKKNVKFTITGVKTTNIIREIELIKSNDWQPFIDKDGFKTNRVYAETWATMDGFPGYFRLIIQRWLNPKQDLFNEEEVFCYHVICTNYSVKDHSALDVIYWHNGRANSENYYKEKKQGFNLNYLPCDNFEANAIWFAIGLMAYNCHVFTKEHFLPNSWRRKTIQTIRWQLIHIAGKVVKHAGLIWLKFSGVSDEFKFIFDQARQKCATYAGP